MVKPDHIICNWNKSIVLTLTSNIISYPAYHGFCVIDVNYIVIDKKNILSSIIECVFYMLQQR